MPRSTQALSERVPQRAGIDAQRAAILIEAERQGWHLVEMVEDAGYSAKDLKRPGVIAALDALASKQADALVVAKLDRLSRSMLDFASIMATAQKQSWGVVALDVNVDTTTPAGEMMANVMATFAQFERRLIGQRTKDALAQRKAAGVRLGRPVELPESIAAEIADHREAGLSFASIARTLNENGVATAHGGAKWWPETVRKVTLRV